MDKTKYTAKVRGYGKAAGAVSRYLTAQGLLEKVPGMAIWPAKDLAEAILRLKRKAPLSGGRGDAKRIVAEFATEMWETPVVSKGSTPAKIKREAPRPRVKASKVKPATEFYWSEEWRRVRYSALRANRGACELCGAGPSPGSPLHVDHIKPRSRFPELELDPENLQVLCADCNLGKSNTDSIDWRKHQDAPPWWN